MTYSPIDATGYGGREGLPEGIIGLAPVKLYRASARKTLSCERALR